MKASGKTKRDESMSLSLLQRSKSVMCMPVNIAIADALAFVGTFCPICLPGQLSAVRI